MHFSRQMFVACSVLFNCTVSIAPFDDCYCDKLGTALAAIWRSYVDMKLHSSLSARMLMYLTCDGCMLTLSAMLTR
jgi:hypothetical protein